MTRAARTAAAVCGAVALTSFVPAAESRPSTARVAASTASAKPLFTSADRTSLTRLGRTLGARLAVAVGPARKGASVQRIGGPTTGVAWSTSKPAVAMAVIAAGKRSEQASNIRAAITASDNASAERLWQSLGSGKRAADAADRQLRASGDRETHYESRRLRAGYTAFGQTQWSLANQARFVGGMHCTRAGRDVLDLMGQIIPSERWGLGAVGHSARFKGGWGPGSRPGVDGGYFERQMGVLTVGGKDIGVAIAAVPSDGSHASGTRDLTALARWVVSHVDVRSVPRTSGC